MKKDEGGVGEPHTHTHSLHTCTGTRQRGHSAACNTTARHGMDGHRHGFEPFKQASTLVAIPCTFVETNLCIIADVDSVFNAASADDRSMVVVTVKQKCLCVSCSVSKAMNWGVAVMADDPSQPLF